MVWGLHTEDQSLARSGGGEEGHTPGPLMLLEASP